MLERCNGGSVPLGRRSTEPRQRLSGILLDPQAVLVYLSDIELGVSQSLVCGLPEPLQRFCIILLDTFAVENFGKSPVRVCCLHTNTVR